MRVDSKTASESDGIRLLAIGDVHLGTRPASLPDDISEFGLDVNMLKPEAALEAAVEQAIRERVIAVVFAGDVVESTNARFEAVRPLEQAVRRLSEEGIPVYAVVGNHDVEALPRLARLIDGFKLIGEGGRWESCTIESDGQPAIELIGWSFAEPQVHSSPVAALLSDPLPPTHAGVPRIGILHGDLDVTKGPYAPFSTRELEEAGLDAWLLGHIHKPSLGDSRDSDRVGPRGYLGSLVGLDPTETGTHGPWLIRIDSSGSIIAQHLAIAPMRWEALDIQVSKNEGPEDLADRLLDETEKLARRIQDSGCTPRALGVRVRLVGATHHFENVRRKIKDGSWNHISRVVGDTVVFVDKVLDGLELVVNLEELAKGDDPPGLLARKLLALEQGGETGRLLIEVARRYMRETAEETRWSPVGEARSAVDPLSDEYVLADLKRSGTALLQALLSQRGSRDPNSGESA